MAEKAKLNTKIFLRLVAYAKVYKAIFVLAFGAGLLIAASSALRPKFIGDMVDKYVVQGQNGQMLLTGTLIIIGMLIMESVLQFTSSYFSNLFYICGHIFEYNPLGTTSSAMVTYIHYKYWGSIVSSI